MSIYFPRCKRKHSSRECPLDNILVCGFFIEDHVTEKCPSFPGLLAIYRSGDPGESYYAPRRPWQPRNQPTYLDLQSQVSPYYQQQQWKSSGWKKWSTQYQHPWIQGWRGGQNQGNPQAPPIPMYNHPYSQFSSNTLQPLLGFVPPPYLLSHNNNCSNFKMQAPQDQHYYRHSHYRIPMISPLNLLTMLRCRPSRHMVLLLFHYRKCN